MIPYRRSNGSVLARDSAGRFRNFTLEEITGLRLNKSFMVCSACGYGERERWMPLVVDGNCPRCGRNDNKPKVIPLSREAEELMAHYSSIEELIGKEFPNPFLLKQYEGRLMELKVRLDEELRSCTEKAFTAAEEVDGHNGNPDSLSEGLISFERKADEKRNFYIQILKGATSCPDQVAVELYNNAVAQARHHHCDIEFAVSMILARNELGCLL